MLWRGGLASRARIASGLVLFAYVLMHFLNLGLVQVDPVLANRLQDGLRRVIGTVPGTVLLYGALLVHMALALYRLAGLRRLRLPPAILVQYVFGLLIPALLFTHIVFTRMASQRFDVDVAFGFIAGLIWNTPSAWKQAALLLLVWIHGCIGLHMWLRLTTRWRRSLPVLAGLATFVPVWALTGFLSEGRRVSGELADPVTRDLVHLRYNWPGPDAFAQLIQARDASHMALYAAFAAAFVVWAGGQLLRRRGRIRIRYVEGPEVATARGPTLLEISRSAAVPHAALCGGRGRCSTCRVIVEDGGEHLPPPSPAEARTLAAVNAPPGARLACQIRPAEPMTVFRVFRSDGRRERNHASQGEERQLAILFLDIRGFTARTAGQLPYDVVFLLNRFFDAVVPEISKAGGSVDKYLGDGLLAIFEQSDAARSARSALQAATGIGRALAEFNAGLQAEGIDAIRIGMGVHMGELVLGEIGAAGNAPRTIIGDTVNAASRLEGETKTLGVELLVSATVLEGAGYDLSRLALTAFHLRGRETPLPALPVAEASHLAEILNPDGPDPSGQ
ncbi:MAG: adenylate/guanylate cyclase domain-containing protein [Marinibacterium sp.]